MHMYLIRIEITNVKIKQSIVSMIFKYTCTAEKIYVHCTSIRFILDTSVRCLFGNFLTFLSYVVLGLFDQTENETIN